MVTQINIFEFIVLMQILYNIFVCMSFAFCMQYDATPYEFAFSRAQQFTDLIFGAVIISLTNICNFMRNTRMAVQKIMIIITNAIYFRLIILTTVSLFFEKYNTTYEDCLLTIAQYIYTQFILTFYIDSLKTVVFCNVILVLSFQTYIYSIYNYISSVTMAIIFSTWSLYIHAYAKQNMDACQIGKTIALQNKMGNILITAFSNALPTKILPKIMKAETLPCEIVYGINFCYMYIKPPELKPRFDAQQSQEVHLSKINQLFCLLDFFTDILDIQKVKSSYTYYMCCTGAQELLSNRLHIAEKEYAYQYDSSKLLITFCLIARQIAESMELSCSCGITKGDVIVGAISMSTSVINFDMYGDTINTAARIARNNKDGVFIYLDQFKHDKYFNDDISQKQEDDDDGWEMENMLPSQLDFSKFKLMFLRAAPQYFFGARIQREYKGKGIVNVQQVLPNNQLKQYVCQAFQHAYILLVSDCLSQNMQNDENNIDEINQMDQEMETSLIESSESFIGSEFMSFEYQNEYSKSNDNHQLTDTIPEEECSSHSQNQFKMKLYNRKDKNILARTKHLINIQNGNQNKTLIDQLQPFDIQEQLSKFDIQQMLANNSKPLLAICHIKPRTYTKVSSYERNSKDGSSQELSQPDKIQPLGPRKSRSSVQKNYSVVSNRSASKNSPENTILDMHNFQLVAGHTLSTDFIKSSPRISSAQFGTGGYTSQLSQQSPHSSQQPSLQRQPSLKRDQTKMFDDTNNEKMLLTPQLHRFLQQAKASNNLRTNYSMLPPISKAPTEQETQGECEEKSSKEINIHAPKQQNIIDQLNPDDVIINEETDEASQIEPDEISPQNIMKAMVQEVTQQTQTKDGACTKERVSVYHKQFRAIKEMIAFLINFSSSFVQGIYEKPELLEIYSKNYNIKYSLIQVPRFLMYWCFSYYFLYDCEHKIRLLNIQTGFKDLYYNITLVMFVLLVTVVSFRAHHQTLINQQILRQKKNTSQNNMGKLLLGQFYKFSQLYTVLIYVLQHTKIFAGTKLLITYKGQQFFVAQQFKYIILVAMDLIMLFSMANNQVWHQTTNVQLISHSIKVQWISSIFFAVVHMFVIPIMALILVFGVAIHTIYIYPTLKSYYISCVVEVQIRGQMNQGKNLLKNILPQITIDSLLTNSQNSDSIKIQNNTYKLFKLQSIEQMMQNGHLKSLQQKLNDTIDFENNNDDAAFRQYYNLRFNQLLLKYSRLPNNRSFGPDRPVINFGKVAYLNLDVCQFTNFCSRHSVGEIQHFLCGLFNRFDQRIKLCKNIIQVKISGDSYELMSLPVILKQYKSKVNLDKNRLSQLKEYDSVVQLIYIGLGFIIDCQTVLQQEFSEWSDVLGLRVGISFGEVIGSLLGNKITRFDAFGEVPILAEEAQAHANKNTIMIDKSAWQILNNNVGVLKDYIIDFVTTETMKNNYVNYNDEMVDFELIENEYGVGVQGVK